MFITLCRFVFFKSDFYSNFMISALRYLMVNDFTETLYFGIISRNLKFVCVTVYLI